ncbi:MAG: multiheme c-type cytochrome [bacterium]
MKKYVGAMFIIGGMMLWVRAMADTGTAPGGETKKEEKPVPTYKGSSACKMCHKTQYESWSKSRMANALESLKPGHLWRKRKRLVWTRRRTIPPTRIAFPATPPGIKNRGGMWTRKLHRPWVE